MTTQAELDRRYGRGPSPRRTVGRVALATVVAVVAGLGLWTAWHQANPPVRWNDISFDLVSADRTDVTFETIMDPGTTAVCTVRALDAGYGEVGTLQVPVGPADQRVVRTTIEVATTGQAVTGGVRGCTTG